MNWLRDILGLSQWAVAWKFKGASGQTYEGRTDINVYPDPTMSLGDAKQRCRRMNSVFGEGSHWPVRVQP